MDEVEFKQHLMNGIMPLHPDTEDGKGKHMLIKIDSGPGQLNMEMIARSRNLGCILCPGVPMTQHR